MQLLVSEAILDFEKQFGYSVKVAISINITMSLSLIAVFLCRRMQQSASGDTRSETPIWPFIDSSARRLWAIILSQ
jgi:hypothetical protein